MIIMMFFGAVLAAPFYDCFDDHGMDEILSYFPGGEIVISLYYKDIGYDEYLWRDIRAEGYMSRKIDYSGLNEFDDYMKEDIEHYAVARIYGGKKIYIIKYINNKRVHQNLNELKKEYLVIDDIKYSIYSSVKKEENKDLFMCYLNDGIMIAANDVDDIGNIILTNKGVLPGHIDDVSTKHVLSMLNKCGGDVMVHYIGNNRKNIRDKMIRMNINVDKYDDEYDGVNAMIDCKIRDGKRVIMRNMCVYDSELLARNDFRIFGPEKIELGETVNYPEFVLEYMKYGTSYRKLYRDKEIVYDDMYFDAKYYELMKKVFEWEKTRLKK